jgi:hypothetical protein
MRSPGRRALPYLAAWTSESITICGWLGIAGLFISVGFRSCVFHFSFTFMLNFGAFWCTFSTSCSREKTISFPGDPNKGLWNRDTISEEFKDIFKFHCLQEVDVLKIMYTFLCLFVSSLEHLQHFNQKRREITLKSRQGQVSSGIFQKKYVCSMCNDVVSVSH